MIASLLFQGAFLWLTVSVVIAPFVGRALHRLDEQNVRLQVERDYIARQRRGMQ